MNIPMNPDWISHLIPLVIAYSVIMLLFVKNRRDMKRLREEAEHRKHEHTAGVSELTMQMEGLRACLRQMEESPVTVAPGQGINLNKRAQALRMYRRGETVPSIAAALRTPVHEVQLVLKLHHMLDTGN